MPIRSIPPNQIEARLRVDNPWWQPPNRVPPPYSGWEPRPYLDLFYPYVIDRSVRRAAVLMGPRRVGKTVVLHHTISKLLEEGIAPNRICYFSVDHPIFNGLSLEDLLEHYGRTTGIDYRADSCFVFFDEIQYLRGWEIHLKALVDRFTKLKLIVSGSAAAALRMKSSESGAGRFTDFMLPPLTFHEYSHLLGLRDLVESTRTGDGGYAYAPKDIPRLNKAFVDYLNFGGYPEVVLSREIRQDPGRFIKRDIIDKVLLRDLPSLYGIQDIQELNFLFTTLAYNTSAEVSLEELSKGSGVAKPTIRKYIEYLQAAFLVRMVHRVDKSAKRFRRANFFKIYLMNPSMRSALFEPVAAEDPAMGPLVETAVFSQWFHQESPLYYARWRQGEVDIVSLGPDQRVGWALEVKWSDRVRESHSGLGSLTSFCRKHRLGQALATTRTLFTTMQTGELRIDLWPASLYAYAVGHMLVHQRLEQAQPVQGAEVET